MLIELNSGSLTVKGPSMKSHSSDPLIKTLKVKNSKAKIL